ncbi:MAG: alpha-amylase family glycosyl hydrolase [Dictyoglomus turgidum]|uniref:alpha-amylase family glycosyl hydrolase n=1 Tax=Dictyoglomus turgidum TaxID=513050 RepID=UPI003C74ADFC
MRKKFFIKKAFVLIFILLIFITYIHGYNEPWYKDSIFYEVFVRSFADSDEDKVGDINGLIEKLDYFKNLNINALWLMPIFPSISYHGYDVTDYYDIHPAYGTLEDFENLVKKAHEKNIKIILDLVINHTSSRHPWFVSATSSYTSPYRDYYIWSPKKPDKNPNLWYQKPTGYYYALFWSEMPDLNFDNPKVREEVKKIAKFWIEKGVDGFRLDAVKHIYDDDYKNIQWWKEFYSYLKGIKPDIYLVGEVWDNEYKIAEYYKGLPSNFNFPLADKIINSVANQRDLGLIEFLQFERELFKESNPNFIDAIFLRNHDQVRVRTSFGGSIDKSILAGSIYLTLPGTPFIYYGEEIGMEGAKPDEYIREPFKWTDDMKSKYQTYWIIPRYNFIGNGIAFDTEEKDPNSIYNHYKRILELRSKYKALSLGSIERIETQDKSILAYKRELNNEGLIVIHNLNRVETTFNLSFSVKNEDVLYIRNAKLNNNKVILGSYSTVIIKIP